MKDERAGGRRRRVLAAALLALCAYLSLESFLPPDRQPSTAVCVGLIRSYQAAGSPVMASAGVRCRYTPTCSHYAAAAFSHYGTIDGLVRTAGRVWRCSPWGGTGYDPAAASTSPLPVQQESEPKRIRELTPEEEKALRDAGAAAFWACGMGCVGSIIVSILTFAVWIVALIYIIKDAKARGDPNAVLWIILAVLFPVIGLVVYFVARPKGELVPCANCKNRRLQVLVKCPHCGADAAGGIKAA